jgi:hypothetical protein
MDIKLSPNFGPSIDLHLRGRINIVCGASATGKTYIYNLLDEWQTPMIESKGVIKTEEALPKIICLNETSKAYEFKEVFLATDHLVIIDNADYLFRRNFALVEFINSNYTNNNTYLIYLRQNNNILVSPNYYAQIKCVNNTLTLDYYYSVQGWY